MIALLPVALAAPGPWDEALRTGHLALMDVATAAQLDAAYDPVVLSNAAAITAWRAAAADRQRHGPLAGGPSHPDPGPLPEGVSAIVVELTRESPDRWYGHVGERRVVPECCEGGADATVQREGSELLVTIPDGVACDDGWVHPVTLRLAPAADGTVTTTLCGRAVRLRPGPSRGERLTTWGAATANALLATASAELPALVRGRSGWTLSGAPLQRCGVTTIDCDVTRFAARCDGGVTVGRFASGWDARPNPGEAMCADHPFGGISDRR